nr:hypothetical protein Iba_chr14cCG1020 [Ipomoea batatas]
MLLELFAAAIQGLQPLLIDQWPERPFRQQAPVSQSLSAPYFPFVHFHKQVQRKEQLYPPESPSSLGPSLRPSANQSDVSPPAIFPPACSSIAD